MKLLMASISEGDQVVGSIPSNLAALLMMDVKLYSVSVGAAALTK